MKKEVIDIGNLRMQNEARFVGQIISEVKFHHKMGYKEYYYFILCTKRSNGQEDHIPIIIDKYNAKSYKLQKNDYIVINGELRSHNYKASDNKMHVSTYVLVLFLAKLSEEDFKEIGYLNSIMLEAYLCKDPIYRKTPLGKFITDLTIVVNREFNKSGYLHAIAWGEPIQKYISKLTTKDLLSIEGAFNSRKYNKSINNDIIERECYELSIHRIGVIDESNSEI